jgi:hypothetical protein
MSAVEDPNPSDFDGKVTQEQIDELERLRRVFFNAKLEGSADLDDAREAYQDYADKLLIDLSGKLDPTNKPPIDVEPPKPTEGTPKTGGNEDPDGWQVVHMKNPPEKFKVVDHTAINIATDFTTDKTAQGYIDWYRWKKRHDQPCPPGQHKDASGNCVPDGPPCPPGQHRDTSGNCVPDIPPAGGLDQFGIREIYKSKTGGKVAINPDVRFFTRHYRSGKPSEPTVECTLDSGTPITDQELTAVITMNGMNHVDSIDWKERGGHHSSSNPVEGTCYDLELLTDGSGAKTLEVESPHPNNHPAHQPQLFKPGDVSHARFGWKGIAINTADGNGVHIESWINLTPDDQSTWQKYIDVTDTKDHPLYKPLGPIFKPFGSLATIRIDGITGHPTFEKVSMREISL